MYPKHFIERFWEGEQKDQIFFGVAFDGDEKAKLKIIKKVAQKLDLRDGAFMQGSEKEAISIPEEIISNIANSKILLFDLSDDKRIPTTNKEKEYHRINQNVMYELGVAMAIREPYEIAIIRKKTDKEPDLPFDIRVINVNSFKDTLTPEFLEELIKITLKKQDLHKNKRIKSAKESIDEKGLWLMNNLGRTPNRNHFSLPSEIEPYYKISLLRLIDLGILKFASEIWSKKGFEYAYHWTDFGYAVMESMDIVKMDEKEFKGSDEEKRVKKGDEEFFDKKKKFFKK